MSADRSARLRAAIGETLDRTRTNVSISAPEMLDFRWREAKEDVLDAVLRVLEDEDDG